MFATLNAPVNLQRNIGYVYEPTPLSEAVGLSGIGKYRESGLGSLGQASSGLGFTMEDVQVAGISFSIPVLIGLLGVGYIYFFGEGAKRQKGEIAKAKAEYKAKVAEIKRKRKRIPRGVYYVAD